MRKESQVADVGAGRSRLETNGCVCDKVGAKNRWEEEGQRAIVRVGCFYTILTRGTCLEEGWREERRGQPGREGERSKRSGVRGGRERKGREGL